MNSKTLTIIAFTVVCLVQLYVPLQMVRFQNTIIETGKEYKFRTAPIDPNDPFRGKYITLGFEDNTFRFQDTTTRWNYQEEVHVQLENDEEGFATIVDVTKEPPTKEVPYVRAMLGGATTFDGYTTLTINYPFNRYYMEETKAPDAEKAYAQSQWDSTQVAYALVSIKDGNAVLKDVLINDVPIKEWVGE